MPGVAIPAAMACKTCPAAVSVGRPHDVTAGLQWTYQEQNTARFACKNSSGAAADTCLGNDTPPGILALSNALCKVWVHQQVAQRRVTLISLFDVVQELCTDDAATLYVHTKHVS